MTVRQLRQQAVDVLFYSSHPYSSSHAGTYRDPRGYSFGVHRQSGEDADIPGIMMFPAQARREEENGKGFLRLLHSGGGVRRQCRLASKMEPWGRITLPATRPHDPDLTLVIMRAIRTQMRHRRGSKS